MWFPVLVAVICAGSVSAAEIGEKVKAKCQWTVSVEYPKFNNPSIDEKIQEWVGEGVKGSMSNAVELVDIYEPEYELGMEIDYETVQASPKVISVAFTTHIFPFRAAHPSANIATLNMSAENGEILTLDTLFKEPDKALAIFSECSRLIVGDNLQKEFADDPDMNVGELVDSDWFKNGSTPTRENFAAFTVTPDGVRVYFQQYQILPYFLGMPDALIPFEKLEPAGPNRKFWPAGSKTGPATER